MHMLQTAGFNVRHKNATQQVSAKAGDGPRNLFGGTAAASKVAGSESGASIDTQNLARGRQGLQGFSSYGELLNEVVEDEFELSTEDQGLHKILVKPTDLAVRGRQNSLLFQSIYNLSAEPGNSSRRVLLQSRPVVLSDVS